VTRHPTWGHRWGHPRLGIGLREGPFRRNPDADEQGASDDSTLTATVDAISVWTIYSDADRDALDALMECVAPKLGVEKPDTSGTEIAFTAETGEVARALDECDSQWRDKALLAPTGPG
jgi:hypothetical protein